MRQRKFSVWQRKFSVWQRKFSVWQRTCTFGVSHLNLILCLTPTKWHAEINWLPRHNSATCSTRHFGAARGISVCHAEISARHAVYCLLGHRSYSFTFIHGEIHVFRNETSLMLNSNVDNISFYHEGGKSIIHILYLWWIVHIVTENILTVSHNIITPRINNLNKMEVSVQNLVELQYVIICERLNFLSLVHCAFIGSKQIRERYQLVIAVLIFATCIVHVHCNLFSCGELFISSPKIFELCRAI